MALAMLQPGWHEPRGRAHRPLSPHGYGCWCYLLAPALRQLLLSAGVWPQDKHHLRGKTGPAASNSTKQVLKFSIPWQGFYYSLNNYFD